MRIPPHNLDAEMSILGGLMVDAYAFDIVSSIITEDDFYKIAHRKIYNTITELYTKSQPIDIITVSNALTDKRELEAIGGAAYLAEVMNSTPSAANIESYAKIVHEKALLRKLIQMSGEMVEKAYGESYESVEAFLDEVEGQIFNITEKKKTQGLVGAAELIKDSMHRLTELFERKADFTGISSGFKAMDKMTSGFQPGEMTIIAARPSMGKTAFSLNVAQHVILREKKSLAYFSVEMGKEQLMTRMLASEARVNLSDLRVGNLSDNAWPRLIDKASKMAEARLFIDDTSGISPFEIRAKCRRLQAQHGLDMIMIDYLQLMDLKQKVESRERAVSEISKTLKAIAKELKVPVVALAQLNRGVEGRSDRRPMLSDLRESGSIEQDADVIMMLYREDYYDRENSDVKGRSEVIIGKQRNGPTGTVHLKWESSIGRFSDLDGGGGEHPLPPPPAQPLQFKRAPNANT
ncbi:MAG TPA: replicative DNA helicase [Bdellovibrionales bacterium]|nr:replicative DNA helicase [Bdellovibrionales bacterium]